MNDIEKSTQIDYIALYEEKQAKKKKKILIITVTILTIITIGVVAGYVLTRKSNFSVDEINWEISCEELKKSCKGELKKEEDGIFVYSFDSIENRFEKDNIYLAYCFDDLGKLTHISMYRNDNIDELNELIDCFSAQQVKDGVYRAEHKNGTIYIIRDMRLNHIALTISPF